MKKEGRTEGNNEDRSKERMKGIGSELQKKMQNTGKYRIEKKVRNKGK